MPIIDESFIRLNGGTVVWDGITQPDRRQDGSLSYNFKVVFPPGHPDVPTLEQYCNQCLQNSEFNGVLPQGGNWPIRQVTPDQYEGMFVGWTLIKFTSKNPQIFNEQGGQVDLMQVGASLYPGQQVDVVANAYAYNNIQKGIGCGFDGFQIIASANAPRINVGNGVGSTARGAFGGQQQQPNQYNQQQPQQNQYGNQQPQQNQYGNQQPQQNQYGNQQQPQQNQYGNQQPQQNQYGNQQQPNQGQGNQYNQQQQQYEQYSQQNNSNQYPQQAEKFLPPQQ